MQQLISLIKQRWIPSIFVLGFLVVIGVNTVLIVKATGSFSGLVVAHPYQKGIEFNRTHQGLEEQKALHWRYRVASEAMPDGRLRVSMTWDEAGLALSGLVLTASLERPVENLPPIPVALADRGGGRYEAVIERPRAGQWDLHVLAERSGHSFIAAERLRVPE